MPTPEEIQQRYEEAKRELMKIPGVVGVGFGAKEVGGKPTDETSIRVYVREKKPESELSAQEIVPKEFLGIKTDVVIVPRTRETACPDYDRYGRVIGGIGVSNLKSLLAAINSGGGSYNLSIGTIGFIAIIDDESSKDNKALITNHHVLNPDGAQNGDSIYNPGITVNEGDETIVKNQERDDTNPIGKILDIGFKDNHAFAYPSSSEEDYYIDCASAKINTCYSSWCDTNCGTDFRNEIRELDIDGSSALAGIYRLRAADANTTTVIKRGRTTRRTVGKIIDPFATVNKPDSSGLAQNVILIESTEANCDGNMVFSEEGDSGSALVNEEREIMGLLWGGVDGSPNRSVGCHIHPVMDRLGITPITTSSHPDIEHASRPVPATERMASGPTPAADLQNRMMDSPQGRRLFQLVESFRSEVTQLINGSRPVMVTWRRNQGPAFLGHFLRNSRVPEHRIPPVVEGVALPSLLRRMSEVLKTYGSPQLRRALTENEAPILACAGQITCIEDFFTHYKLVTP